MDGSSKTCPLCSLFRQSLETQINTEYEQGPPQSYDDPDQDHANEDENSWVFGDPSDPPVYNFDDRKERLQALESDPWRIFLNPLCLDHAGGRLLPYQFRELSVWSATPHKLDKIEPRQDKYEQEYSYFVPRLASSLDHLGLWVRKPELRESFRRALAVAKRTLKTSWGKFRFKPSELQY